MTGLWIRVDADEVNGERVAVLVAELGIDPIQALGHLVAFSGKVAHHRPEGIISDVSPALLELWAVWRGERGAFARVVLERLCEPPGELREWEATMGDLLRRRRLDRERKAEERRLEKEARARETEARQGLSAVPGQSADSPRISAPTERNGTGRDGTNGESHSTGSGKPGPAVEKSSKKRDTLDGLPPNAVRLLTLFYGNAPPKRKRDVLAQLRDTIDPARPGAVLDRHTTVRARSLEQLDEACARILARPPRDLDLGVRFVLHELTALEKAARVAATEGSAARSQAEERHDAAWRHARGIAVARWEREHPERAAELRAQAERDLPDAKGLGEIGRLVVVERYAQLAADVVRFPSVDAWRPVPGQSSDRHDLTRVGEVAR